MRDVPWGKIGALAGVLFVVLLLAGMISLGGSPYSGDPDEDHVEWWSDSGNQTLVLIGAYLLTLAGLAFLGFMSQVRRLLMVREEASGPLVTLSFAASIIFVAMLIAGAVANAAIAGEIKFQDAPVPDDADLLRLMPQLGIGLLLLGGGLSAAVAVAAASWAILRTGVFARWLGWLGIVAAVVLLASVFFIPMIALPIWVLAASFELWRRPAIAA